MIHHIKKDHIELSLIYVCMAITVILISSVIPPIKTVTHLGIIKSTKNQEKPSMYNMKVFENISIKAKAYIVYDIVDQKIVSSRNENEILPLASLTKIMTAITALATNDEDTKITINTKSIDAKYDLGLKNKQVWKLGELLKYTLVFSSNDGAQIIADELWGRDEFIEQMNLEAKLLDLKTFSFTHPAGLDVNGKIGGIGSAFEFAKLMAVAHRKFPDILDATTKDRATLIASSGKVVGIPNTNQNISNLIGAEASKTGFTELAGGNLAIIADISVGRPVVIVVLGSTHEERFSDVETLYKTTIQSLKK